MDNNAQGSSFNGYKVAPTENGVVNANLQQKESNKLDTKSSISESYVIKNNTVK